MSLHFVFNRATERLKGYAVDGTLAWEAPCHNETVNPGFGHYGECPPGDYHLAFPEIIDPPEVPYGSWFIPLVDVDGLWIKDARSGIGVHGGGSGLPSPFAAKQGWQITEGCFRLQNEDLTHFVALVHGGETFTVT
jgi:hypothetical protein